MLRLLSRLAIAGVCAVALAVGGEAATLHPDGEITEPTPQGDARFGSSLTTGDVNGDGVEDAIVGSTGLNSGQVIHAGEVNVFLGPSFTHAATLYSPSGEPRFGEAIAAGDINGDGFDDVVVGSRYAQVGPHYGAGEVFVFFGPGFGSVQTLNDPIPQAAASFGVSVAAGDTNGDGYDEVIAGAWDSNHSGFLKAGEAFIFSGPALTSVTTVRSPDPQNVADFGVATAIDDFDGDGYGDAIVGSWVADTVAPDTGRVFVFHGPTFTTVTPLDPPSAGTSDMGRYLATGDVDGDGAAEVIAAAIGEAVVFDSTGPGSYNRTVLELPGDWGTIAVTGLAASDATGDGIADIVIGASARAYGGGNNIGGALLYVGAATSSPYTLQMPTAATAEFGWRAAIMEGFALIAAPARAVGALSGAGRVFIVPVEDPDKDGWLNIDDGCPSDANPAQANADADLVDLPPQKAFDDATWPNSDLAGDICDDDDDNDGLSDAAELTLPSTACPPASATTDVLVRDTDGDGMLDRAECLLGSDPSSATSLPAPTAPNDTDHDGLPDTLETTIGTNADQADSDGDRISDGIEVRGYNSDPLAVDTDSDGCSDGREIASINGDRAVNSIDLAQIAQSFGTATSPGYVAHFDVNRDGKVSAIDLGVAAQQFGGC